jgi:hypothetical protein
MDFVLRPWHLLLVCLAGWLNREQLAVVEYLRTENQILREIHGKKRILLIMREYYADFAIMRSNANDAERRAA